jgi:mannitol-specific phosphotransferase system IIBC component
VVSVVFGWVLVLFVYSGLVCLLGSLAYAFEVSFIMAAKITVSATQKSNKTEYKTMKSKNTAKAKAQTQQHCSTCQRQKSEHCGKCRGFNNYKPNFTTMESFQ